MLSLQGSLPRVLGKLNKTPPRVRREFFPNNNQTLGEYDFRTQSIELPTFSSHDLTAVLKDTSHVAAGKQLPVLAHELAHHCDFVGSRWGIDTLKLLFQGYQARLTNDPTSFHLVVAGLKELRNIHLPKYFSTYGPSEEVGAPREWAYRFSCGQRFDSSGKLDATRPIVFITFTHKDHLVARVPMSIASLLETSAIRDEVITRHALIQKISDEDVGLVESRLYENEIIRMIYTKSLALYSAAAHVIANICKLNETTEALDKSASLARLCLNLDPSLLRAIPIPEEVAGWGGACEQLRTNADRGFAFLSLAFCGRDSSESDASKWLEEVVRIAGLPTLSTIHQQAIDHFAKLESMQWHEQLHPIFADLTRNGKSILDKRGPFGNASSLKCLSDTCPILCSDLSFLCHDDDRSTGKYWEQRVQFMLWMYDACDEFLNACY